MNDVLIVEDHPFVAEATQRLVSKTYPLLQVTLCSSADEAMSAINDDSKAWHRILLDLDVPGAHGLSLAMELHAANMQGITCIVSASKRRDFVAQVRGLGFLGYIQKAMPMNEFPAALDRVFRGERVFSDLSDGPREEIPRLTKRQTEILDLLRHGLRDREIAERLGLVEGTVTNQIKSITSELKARSRSHAVALAIDLGLLKISPI
ncbi:MAG: hypothetical protein DI530_18455 [Sphingomonas sp.]|uniref:Two component transcriptional regulator, LuxR family n=1 Tax=Variovorax paradoxus TaxID=34073 RepID=A0A2W5QMT9_VARPD|nr:response regulator transcription factor [Sphingomonas sp.]PZQ76175.1 MAG: hypothetical protein DI563_07700 [Variovorax paradoxus]PZU71865.1 MAG: hypothetical protein DI530_18455 [Sphingomonas sp.]